MKEREPDKPFLVIYDGLKCIGWKTEQELRGLIEANKVDFYKFRGREEATWIKEPTGKVLKGMTWD